MNSQSPRPDRVPVNVRRSAFLDLCADYDPLLKPGAEGNDAALAVLTDFARIFDLAVDPDATAGGLWRQVRPLLVAQMGDLVGTSEGAGAAVGRVFLPATAALDSGPFLDGAAALSLLVVEDDPELAAAVVETLTDAGHQVVAMAATAEQAATLAALHAIDFAIVDVELEGPATGVELACQLHERWGVSALFVSGGPNEHLVDHHAALGFVGKPFNSAELLAAVTMAAALLRRTRR